MGNMPVIKDLIVDMDAVHWKKIQRVTPWLINKEPIPEREYIVPRESMIDVTQSMACIQCGACVSDCLSMEVDPLFIGPAALAKAYRFVGDPRDAEHERAPQGPRRGPARHVRLHALLQVHRGVPEGRRADEPDHAPAPRRRQRLRHQGPQQRLPPRARVRQEHRAQRPAARGRPAARLLRRQVPTRAPVPELVGSLPAITKALLRRKVTPAKALLHQHKAPEGVKAIYETVEGREERVELNLYITATTRTRRRAERAERRAADRRGRRRDAADPAAEHEPPGAPNR